MNQTTLTTFENATEQNPYMLVGIFANLAINLFLIIERIFSKLKKSECTIGADGASMKVDNSQEKA